MTKLPQLPEEIIGYILSFAPDYRDNLKKCQSELLENRPICYSTFVKSCYDYHDTIPQWLDDYRRVQTKYVNGVGKRLIWVHSIEISPVIRHDSKFGWNISCHRDITIRYGWGREKDHESWKAVLKGEAGRKNLTTGYH
jgi:hypothetical protein